MNITYKTAESICEGHPDKLCDKIAVAILDAYLRKDKSAHVAVEVMAVGRRLIVGGEISSTAKVNIQAVVWRVLDDIGMKSWRRLLQVYVRRQSPDIAGGVKYSLESRNGDDSWYSSMGAGDQGTIYGYAIDEGGYRYLPLPLLYAHVICKKLDECRKSSLVHDILPDGKAQDEPQPDVFDEDANEETGLTISLPLEKVAAGNLTNLLEAKGSLIKKALGIDDLGILITEDTISFPWFSTLPEPDEVNAYTHFIAALCKMSKDQKRISNVVKPVDNEKYAFRCFLLRLGFIGNKYKTERKILLRNLTGSAAFKSGAKKEVPSNEIFE